MNEQVGWMFLDSSGLIETVTDEQPSDLQTRDDRPVWVEDDYYYRINHHIEAGKTISVPVQTVSEFGLPVAGTVWDSILGAARRMVFPDFSRHRLCRVRYWGETQSMIYTVGVGVGFTRVENAEILWSINISTPFWRWFIAVANAALACAPLHDSRCDKAIFLRHEWLSGVEITDNAFLSAGQEAEKATNEKSSGPEKMVVGYCTPGVPCWVSKTYPRPRGAGYLSYYITKEEKWVLGDIDSILRHATMSGLKSEKVKKDFDACIRKEAESKGHLWSPI